MFSLWDTRERQTRDIISWYEAHTRSQSWCGVCMCYWFTCFWSKTLGNVRSRLDFCKFMRSAGDNRARRQIIHEIYVSYSFFAHACHLREHLKRALSRETRGVHLFKALSCSLSRKFLTSRARKNREWCATGAVQVEDSLAGAINADLLFLLLPTLVRSIFISVYMQRLPCGGRVQPVDKHDDQHSHCSRRLHWKTLILLLFV